TIGSDNLRSLNLLRDEQSGSRLPGVDASAPLHIALGYELDRLPTFATPAPVLTDLRIAHASCRRTNAEGADAMAFLDDIIHEKRSDPAGRPQQLFLTGDQIYADDLGSCLLPVIDGLSFDLLGFRETLPITNNDIVVDLTNFPALRRRHLVREIGRFSTVDGTNHLLSFGELVAMHLAVWSPRLWRPLATANQVFVPSTKVADNHLQDWEAKYGSTAAWKAEQEEGFTKEAARVGVFRAAVPRVARVLANCATYMIFDDHEVTDDWYLSQSWRQKVLTAPFGRAVVRNALGAYAVCQAWGNDPAAFSHTGAATKPKGEELLDTLEAVGTAKSLSAQQRGTLETLLGLTQPVIDPPVPFHYSVPGPRHMVRVLDTRTRRRYKGRLGPPNLLGPSLNAQLPEGPLTDGRELLVVVSPVPIFFPRLFETLIQPLAATLFDLFTNIKEKAKPDEDGLPITGNENVDFEGWGGDEVNLEAMIRRLGTYPKTIVLSGDVHFASTLALDFWNGPDPNVDARVVQLTSSASRNGTDANRQAVIRASRFSQQLLQGLPFERLGWTGKSSIVVPGGRPISPARRSRLRREPGLLPARGWPEGTTIPADKPPNWRWRLTVLRDTTPRAELVHPEGLQPPLPAFNGADPLASYNAIAATHAQLALSPKELLRTLVFRTNLGLVSFPSEGSDHAVVHELWSVEGENSTEGGPFTKHRASLGLTPSPAAPQLQVAPGG
ncbi:MAG: hypothetical protein LC733_09165, partial [Actinobacteria bacterium]|nr:hypothetical protein [Actinomycetota bacterium]